MVEVLKDQLGEVFGCRLSSGTAAGNGSEIPGDEEYLDGLFQSIRRLPPQTLIGIREEGRVLVYTQ